MIHTGRSSTDFPPQARLLLAGVAALAAALTVAVFALDPTPASIGTIAVLAVFVAGGEAVRIDLPHRGAGNASFTLSDAALAAGLLFASGTQVVAAVIVAVTAMQLIERVRPVKFLTNLAQYTAGASAAALLVQAFAPRPGPVAPAVVGVVIGGLAVFVMVNVLVVSAMIALTGGGPWRSAVARIAPAAAALMAGSAALGVLAVVLLDSPWALPGLAFPLFLLYTGSRERIYAAVARERSAVFVEIEQRLGAASHPDEVATTLVEGIDRLLGCHAAVWYENRWVTPVPDGSRVCPVDPELDVALVSRGPVLGPAIEESCAAVGLGFGVLVAWPDELDIDEEAERWLERLGRSGRTSFERVAARGALEQERATLRAVVDGTGDGIFVLNSQGIVRLWNPAMARLSQLAAERAMGRPIDEILGGGPWAVGGVHDVYRSPQRVWRVSVASVRDRIQGVLAVGVVHDVSAERRVARMKDDMLAVVSHELRTPLTPIKASAQLLRHRWERMPAEQRQSLLSEIEGRAEHLTRLVEDLLLVAQLASSSHARPRIATSKADYVGVLAAVVAELDETHTEHRIELHAPDTLDGATDPLRLRQIVTNLIDNACKFSAPGTTVTVTVSAGDQHVSIEVTDRGRGIPPEDVQRVFERFERVEDPLHMTTSGAGLGLYIARSLTKALGGEIALHSAPGVGTTVTVTLPRAQSKADRPRATVNTG